MKETNLKITVKRTYGVEIKFELVPFSKLPSCFDTEPVEHLVRGRTAETFFSMKYFLTPKLFKLLLTHCLSFRWPDLGQNSVLHELIGFWADPFWEPCSKDPTVWLGRNRSTRPTRVLCKGIRRLTEIGWNASNVICTHRHFQSSESAEWSMAAPVAVTSHPKLRPARPGPNTTSVGSKIINDFMQEYIEQH